MQNWTIRLKCLKISKNGCIKFVQKTSYTWTSTRFKEYNKKYFKQVIKQIT